MRIVIGADHGGVELKDDLVRFLRERGYEVIDAGCDGPEAVDYPDYARVVAEQVASGVAEHGILLCTNGIGMTVVANKFPGIRAALVRDVTEARMSREHTNANVLALGGGMVGKYLAREIVHTWLTTPFAGGRHQRRLEKIAALERELGLGLRPLGRNGIAASGRAGPLRAYREGEATTRR